MAKYKLTNVRFTEEEHEALRYLALSEGRSMADIQAGFVCRPG